MTRKLFALSIIPLLITSCVVSKKKYEELEFAKRRSDAKMHALDEENTKKKEEIEDLNSKLNKTLAEYNEMKNSMAESNAQKNSEIDNLSTELIDLASDTTTLKTRLEDTMLKYKDVSKENKRNEAKIKKMSKQLQVLKNEAAKLTSDLKTAKVNLDWNEKKYNKEQSKLMGQLRQKDKEISRLAAMIEEKDGKLSWLRKVKKQNETEIERLTNKMNLYKKEYEKSISK
jgi:peptidoglycan hydrolase CwlO-like protein